MDAFSSDAIPLHLITREAVQLYLKTVRKDGVLTFHISNRYVDLRPVLANIVEDLRREEGMKDLVVVSASGEDGSSEMETIGKSAATWVVIGRSETVHGRLMTELNWEPQKTQFQQEIKGFVLTPVHATSGFGMPAILFGVSQGLEAPWKTLAPKPDVGVWTDDYSNLLKVFLW